MSTSYTMRIVRPNDRKVIAELECNQVKCLLNVDEKLIDTDRGEMRLSRFYESSTKIGCKMEELRQKIDYKKKGVFACKTVDVKREIEDEIAWHEESLQEWKAAYESVWEMIGIIRCLTETLLMERGKSEDEEYDTYKFAYSHWGWEEKGSDGKPEKKYMWAEDALVYISDSWSEWPEDGRCGKP